MPWNGVSIRRALPQDNGEERDLVNIHRLLSGGFCRLGVFSRKNAFAVALKA